MSGSVKAGKTHFLTLRCILSTSDNVRSKANSNHEQVSNIASVSVFLFFPAIKSISYLWTDSAEIICVFERNLGQKSTKASAKSAYSI